MKAKLQAPSAKLQGSSNSKTAESHYPEFEPILAFISEADPAARHVFDLEERTARFGEAILRFVKKVPPGPANNRLVGQLAGCGTSIGANYCEANEGVSKKDFRCIIGRCKKESKETKFFLRMMATAEPPLAPEARLLYREAHELHLIFCAMFRKAG